jgi:hypothetical protein
LCSLDAAAQARPERVLAVVQARPERVLAVVQAWQQQNCGDAPRGPLKT